MLELICSIPENIGWVIVGACGTLTALLAIKLVCTCVTAVKEYHLCKEDETEE